MFVRKAALENSGGGFDEQYFMYCEDVDMCHRLTLHGYKNYYYPETSVLHFKGESTRKLTFSYMRIFYEAHALFVKKYYSQRLGTLYNTALKMVLGLRNTFSVLKHVLALFKMFLMDTLILSFTLYFFAKFWFSEVAHFDTSLFNSIAFIDTIPIYVLIWLVILYLNGAYDKPYSLFRTGRGMLIGSVVVLAIYGLMPFDYRFSRGVMLFSGMTSTIVMILARSIFSMFKIIRLVPRGKNEYKAAIVGANNDYESAKTFLLQNNYMLEIIGNVSTSNQQFSPTDIGSVSDFTAIQEVFSINEFIFINQDLPYKNILKFMESAAPKANYKFLSIRDKWLIGCNTDNQFFVDSALSQRFNITMPNNKRNKRLLDILVALCLLIISPIYVLLVENSFNLFNNIFQVLLGRKTWIGYNKSVGNIVGLPKMKPAIVLPLKNIDHFDVTTINVGYLMYKYAKDYSYLDDLTLLLKNVKILGKKS